MLKIQGINAGVQAYIKAKYLALAADQISFGESYLIKEGDEIVDICLNKMTHTK